MRSLVWAPLLLVAAAQPAAGQREPDTAAQAAAIHLLDAFDGAWRGTAEVQIGRGPPRKLIQTERVGSLLGGNVKVIEGRAYNPDGSDGHFNALGIISYDDAARAYTFRAYAQGRSLTVPMTVTPGGYAWAMPAGPGMQVAYVATVKDGGWHEEGWLERGGQRVAKVFATDLRRVSSTDWPAVSPVGPR